METGDFPVVTRRRRNTSGSGSEAENATTNNNISSVTGKKERIPPITIDGVERNWPQFLKELGRKGITFQGKCVGNFLGVFCKNLCDFRFLQRHLT